MALSFPLSGSEFWGGLAVASASFHLPEAMQVNRTAGGAILTASLGERLWTTDIQLDSRSHVAAAKSAARLSILREPGRSIYAYPLDKQYPAADPDGTILGASTVTIHTLVTGNREIRLQGLPAAYVISDGDFLSFVYGGKHALHQVVVGATADGSGITPAMEVTPNIRAGATTGLTVQLIRPFCRMVYVPGSHRPGSSARALTSGFAASFIQTLKA